MFLFIVDLKVTKDQLINIPPKQCLVPAFVERVPLAARPFMNERKPRLNGRWETNRNHN